MASHMISPMPTSLFVCELTLSKLLPPGDLSSVPCEMRGGPSFQHKRPTPCKSGLCGRFQMSPGSAVYTSLLSLLL